MGTQLPETSREVEINVLRSSVHLVGLVWNSLYRDARSTEHTKKKHKNICLPAGTLHKAVANCALLGNYAAYSMNCLHNVSGQPIGPLCNRQEDWNDRLSQNVGKELKLYAAWVPRRARISANFLPLDGFELRTVKLQESCNANWAIWARCHWY